MNESGDRSCEGNALLDLPDMTAIVKHEPVALIPHPDMQPRHVTYFNSQADLGRSFLHPGGKWATRKLLSMIPTLDAASSVLEIGCGMGHTASLLLDASPATYVGVDVSPRMLRHAGGLLSRFADRATLYRCDVATSNLPVESESVNVVYAESVVAIIEPRRVLKEVQRVLKRNGIVLINDRIWSDTIDMETRREFNSLGLSLYGFPFASDDPGTALEWKETLAASGFDCYFAERLNFEGVPEEEHRLGGLKGWRKLLRGAMAPGMLVQSYRDRKVSSSLPHVWEHMEPWLFGARKQ
jgi:SAM-dependent methyltransferase